MQQNTAKAAERLRISASRMWRVEPVSTCLANVVYETPGNGPSARSIRAEIRDRVLGGEYRLDVRPTAVARRASGQEAADFSRLGEVDKESET